MSAWLTFLLVPTLLGASAWFGRGLVQRRNGSLQQLLEASRHAFIRMDSAGRISEWNRAASTLFGWQRSEVLGRPLAQIVFPERLHAAQQALLDQLVAQGDADPPGPALEVDACHRDGHEFSIELDVWAIRSPKGVHLGALLRDISERRRARSDLLALNATLAAQIALRSAELAQTKEAADAANRVKAQFLAIMSHEIRTPMNGVVGMAEVLRQYSLDATARDAIDTIRDSADVLLRRIDDILDYTRLETETVSAEPCEFALPALLQRACADQQDYAQARGVDLGIRTEASLPPLLRGDAGRLQRILRLLLANAIKFSGGRAGRPGTVELQVGIESTEPLQLRFSVLDNGIGMNEATVAALFQPFAPAAADSMRRYGGSGLGLALCKRLVELLGGRIEVHSVLGYGARFTVVLPFERAAANSAPAQQSSPATATPPAFAPCLTPPSIEAARRSGRLLLVAEDDEINQKVILRQLGLLGYAGEIAADGVSAFELWRTHRHALVLTDLHMPELDGYGLTAALRAEQPDAERLPIIALTANALQGEADRTRQAGMNAYLTKPIQLEALCAVLLRWMPAPERSPADAPRAAKPAKPCVDLEVLRSYIGDADEAVLLDFLGEFRTNLQGRHAELNAAHAAGDVALIARIAHRMKSSAATIGAAALASTCAALEQIACTGDTAALLEELARYQRAAAEVAGQLDEMLATEQI